MKIPNIQYKINSAKEQEIVTHLIECDSYFFPPLSKRVSILSFSQKIYNNSITFEAWHHCILVGMVSAYFNDKDRYVGFINNVSVLKGYNGLGIGTTLLKMCLEYGKLQKFEEITLEVNIDNEKAINIYKVIGFCIVKEKGNNFLMKIQV